MIRLQNNHSEEVEIEDSDTIDTPKPLKSLDTFANEVLSSLENIPQLPANHQAFFEQMLGSYDLIQSDTKNDDRNINFEKDIAFAKELLKCTQTIYKNFTFVNDLQEGLRCL